QAFSTQEYREVGPAHFFFVPNPYDRPSRGHSGAAGRARLAPRCRRRRAARSGGAADLHRPPRRGGPGALRTGHQAPEPPSCRLFARGLLPGAQVRARRPIPRSQGELVSKEIVEAIKALEQEKGTSADKLMDALADALLSAYKKTP